MRNRHPASACVEVHELIWLYFLCVGAKPPTCEMSLANSASSRVCLQEDNLTQERQKPVVSRKAKRKTTSMHVIILQNRSCCDPDFCTCTENIQIASKVRTAATSVLLTTILWRMMCLVLADAASWCQTSPTRTPHNRPFLRPQSVSVLANLSEHGVQQWFGCEGGAFWHEGAPADANEKFVDSFA